MRRCNYRMLLAVGAAAFVGLLLSADQAEARWGSWGSSGSSGGSWGSSGSSGGNWGSSGSSGGSWGSSGGSWGSSGGSWGYVRRTPIRTAARVILPPYGHHRRYYSSYGSSGGNWGSSGSSGGNWGSSGSSGGNWGSSGSSGGSWGSSGGTIVDMDGDDDNAQPAQPAQPTPPVPPQPGTTPPLPKDPAKTTGFFGDADAVMISVSLPEGSKLFVNGNATRSTGSERTFISRGLEAGKRYKYELRAEGEKDGKPVSESKVVYVTAGDQTSLVFGAEGAENIAIGKADEAPAAKPVSAKGTDDKTTTLRLHVPAEAQVTLSGATTKSTGPVRVFCTSKLADGQAWDNYVVKAELTQNGKTVTREATITLKAGETRDLTLDFDSQLAAVASNSAL